MKTHARGSKAGAKAEAQAMGQARRERCKSAREDMGVHHGDCPSRELDACLKFVPDEWNEQVPKQMDTLLGGKWDGWGKQLKLAAQRRLARGHVAAQHIGCAAQTHLCPLGNNVHHGTSSTNWQVPVQYNMMVLVNKVCTITTYTT